MKTALTMDMRAPLAVAIVEFRTKQGWTQHQLAEQTGIPLSCLNKYEITPKESHRYVLPTVQKALIDVGLDITHITGITITDNYVGRKVVLNTPGTPIPMASGGPISTTAKITSTTNRSQLWNAHSTITAAQ